MSFLCDSYGGSASGHYSWVSLLNCDVQSGANGFQIRPPDGLEHQAPTGGAQARQRAGLGCFVQAIGRLRGAAGKAVDLVQREFAFALGPPLTKKGLQVCAPNEPRLAGRVRGQTLIFDPPDNWLAMQVERFGSVKNIIHEMFLDQGWETASLASACLQGQRA